MTSLNCFRNDFFTFFYFRSFDITHKQGFHLFRGPIVITFFKRFHFWRVSSRRDSSGDCSGRRTRCSTRTSTSSTSDGPRERVSPTSTCCRSCSRTVRIWGQFYDNTSLKASSFLRSYNGLALMNCVVKMMVKLKPGHTLFDPRGWSSDLRERTWSQI